MLNVKQLAKKADVDSSAVSTIRYNHALQTLTVTFTSGAVYDYMDVPPFIYAQITNADSHGRAFVSLVKNNYEFVKVNRSGTGTGASGIGTDVIQKKETTTSVVAENPAQAQSSNSAAD